MHSKAGSLLAAVELGKPIPADHLRSIERTLQLRHFKWDIQVGDTSVLSPQPLLIARSAWDWLCARAEQATRELYGLEQAIAGDRDLRLFAVLSG